jgi:drug/metabolite transporter (DMT)-like permease
LTADSLERAASRADRIPLGILFMLGATVMFAISSALSKWQVAEYSFIEVLFFRAIASLATCAVLILPRTVRIDAAGGRRRHQLLLTSVRDFVRRDLA